MHRRVVCVAAVLFVILASTARSSWMQRLEALAGAQRIAIAPLPGGGHVVATNESPGAFVTLDAKGEVRAARQHASFKLVFLTTTPSGEIYAGLLGGTAVRLAKLRSDLSIVWARHIATTDGEPIALRRAAGTRDGGVLVAGVLNAGAVFVKIDARGNVQWATRIDPTDEERINALSQTRDGGFVAAGASPRWPWLLRLAPDGRLLWQRGYGPLNGTVNSVVETSGGAIVAAGTQNKQPLIFETNARGDVTWSKVSSDPGYGLALAAVEGATVATMESAQGLHILSLSSAGAIRWQKKFTIADRGAITMEFENAMLARAGGGVAFTASYGPSIPITVYQIDSDGTTATCARFSEGRVTLEDRSMRPQELVVEISAPGLITTTAEVALQPFAVSASPENCVTPDGVTAYQPPPVRNTLAFRSADDSREAERRYVNLLIAKKFAELDEIASKLRRERPSRDPMRPNFALTTFYDALADESLAPAAERLARLREWAASHPDSISAQVALATALHGEAWNARGGGYASTVTAAGSARYAELMNEAKEVHDRLGAKGEIDPAHWSLHIDLTHEMDLGDVREVGLRALAMHPDPELARAVSRFLHPKWGGSPEIYMDFADQAARATRSTYGEGIYLWLVHQIDGGQPTDEYKQYKSDWDRVVQGAHDIIRMRPDWPPSYHRLAKLAYRYQKRPIAHVMFQRPELEWYEDADWMWGDRHFYEYVRIWALERLEADMKRWPATLFAADGDSSAFLVETPDGTSAIGSTVPSDGSRGVPLRVTPAKAPQVQPLKLQKQRPGWGAAYVVLCRHVEGRCQQEVIEGQVLSIGVSFVPKYRSGIRIALVLPSNATIHGAAVMNKYGEVFGVVTGSEAKPEDGKTVLIADDVHEVLDP